MPDWTLLTGIAKFDQVIEQDWGGEDCETPSPLYFSSADAQEEVVFSISLAEFKLLLGAILKGATLSYPDTWHNVAWSFLRAFECMVNICDRVALCLTEENEALINALAAVLETNETIINAIQAGQQSVNSPQPGQPASQTEVEKDRLPENVKDGETCLQDELWGASLYIVQSANRAITDFFEVLEAASNSLERGDIVLDTIPVVGEFLSSAVSFADQLEEEIAEGYAASYTETYEEQLACSIFCTAQEFCSINVDQIINILVARFEEPFDVSDFLTVMNAVITGSFVGDAIADAAMIVYFTALKFGQAFGSVIGLHSITEQASLGADVLASDNWETLCDCGWESVLDFTLSDYGFEVNFGVGNYVEGVGFEDEYVQVMSGNGYRIASYKLPLANPAQMTYAEITFEYEEGTIEHSFDVTVEVGNNSSPSLIEIFEPTIPASPEEGSGNIEVMEVLMTLMCGVILGTGDPGGSCTITKLVLRGFGDKPAELP